MTHLLEETHGNLYVFNELDRFAELSPHEQIRLASNDVKLSQFSAGWEDEHALSQPLTGAIFDIGVDIFQELLVERGLIPRDVAEATRIVRDEPELRGDGAARISTPPSRGSTRSSAPRWSTRATMWAWRSPRPGSGSRPTIFPISTSAESSSKWTGR